MHRFETKLPPDISDLWEEAPGQAGTTRSFRSGDAAALSAEARFFQAADLPTLKDIGERVLDCLFDLKNSSEGPKIMGALEDRIADNEGVELEFDLSQTAELSGIPWESLYLRSRDRFLAIGTSSNIVRKLDAQAELPPAIELPIRILVVAANPKEDLETDVELGNIQRRIEELVAGGDTEFEIASLPDATRDDFRRKVNEWQPHIIHYIGHSSFDGAEGSLYFESEEEGKSDRVSAEVLRNMLLNRRPWLVVLNSCQSGATSRDAPMAGMAQNLLQRLNIPFVVAMQQPVSDEAAINFSQDFYTALTSGETVASAVTIGRCAIANDADELTQCELITPVLYTSGDVDRLQFAAALAPAAVVAATPASVAAPADKTTFLQSLDSSTKTIASIVGSLTAVGAAAFGVWQWMAPDTDDTAPPQIVAAAPAVPGPDMAPLQEVQQSPLLGASPSAAAAVPVLQVRQAPRTRSLARTRSREIAPPAEQQGASYTLPDGRVVFVPDGGPLAVESAASPSPPLASPPPLPPPPYALGDGSQNGPAGYSAGIIGGGALAGGIFEQPGAPPPLTEAGGGEGLGEPYDSVSVQPPDYPQILLSMQDAQRVPAFCDGRALTVRYELGSTTPVAGDRSRLQSFTQQLACPRSKLVVAGFTDTTGSERLNRTVSLERAIKVIDELQPFGDIFVTRTANGYAESNQAVTTADDIEEAANRRAEVYLDFDCPAEFETTKTLVPGESYRPTADTKPYPGTPERPVPIVVALQQRDLSGPPDAETLAWLQATAEAVGDDIGAPSGMVFPMIVGGACLKDDQDMRIDIIY